MAKQKTNEAAASSLGAAILAPAIEADQALPEPTPIDETEILTPEASAAEPPIEDQVPQARTAPATDYSANERSERGIHPAAREPRRFTNVAVPPTGQPVDLVFVDVDIKRDLSTSMRKSVPIYVVPILEKIHEEVTVVEGSEHVVAVDRFNPAEEFQRLKERYDTKAKEHVAAVYPMGAMHIAQITGTQIQSGKFEQRQSEQTIRSREGQVLRNVS